MNHRPSFWAVFVLVVVQIGGSSAECGGDPSACGAAPAGSNTDVDPVQSCYSNNDVVVYVCDGYLKGPDDNTCQNGHWQTTFEPICEVFTCGIPTDDSDVIRNPSKATYGANERVDFSCPEGANLAGPSYAICTEQDKWKPSTKASCKATCGPPAVPNSEVIPTKTEYTENEKATVQCDDGYSLEAGTSATITCGSNGWEEPLPQCLSQCDVPAIPNSDLAAGDTLNHGETIYIDCDDGFSYNQETKFEVTCGYSGLQEKTVMPTECFSDCILWTAPANGAVTSDYRHGATATFSCNVGYAITNSNDATTTCNDGSWDLVTAPTCDALTAEESITLTCDSDKFRVHIPVALLNNPSGETIHFQDKTCVGEIIDSFVELESSYNDCGTTSQVDDVNQEISYINRVSAENFEGAVTTEKQLDISTQCSFDRNNLVSTTFIIANNITSGLAFHSGPFFTLKVYKEETFSAEEPPPVHLYGDQLAYLKIQLESGKNETLFGTHCHATPSNDAYDSVNHVLLEDGCPRDDRVTVIETESPSIFPKPAFAFSMSKLQLGDSDTVYIHCYAKICEAFEDCTRQCPMTHRRRRSSDSHIYQLVSSGALVWKPETTTDRRLDEQVVMYLLFACAVISTLSLCLVIYLSCRYFSRRSVVKTDRDEQLEYE